MILHACAAAGVHDPRVYVGEGTVDLVPLLHAGFLDFHEYFASRGLGASLGYL